MKPCFMFKANGVPALIVRRTAAIGDAVMCLSVAEKLNALGIEVVFQTAKPIQPIIARCPWVSRVESPGFDGVSKQTGRPNVWGQRRLIDLDRAMEAEKVNRNRHFQEVFFEAANRQAAEGWKFEHRFNLGPPLNCRPVLKVRENETAAVRATLDAWPRPRVFLCPRSNSWPVRQVPDGIWLEAAKLIKGTCFWLGTHPGPLGIVDLQCRTPEMLPPLLAVADLLVTVDTGPMHIAAALGVPMVVILQSSSPEMHLSDQRDWRMISANLDCLHCMEKVCPKNRAMPPCQQLPPDFIAQQVNQRLTGLADGKVSTVIPTYQAPARRLAHVIDAVAGQVEEIVVTRALDGAFPEHAANSKVRWVVKQQREIGFGRNVNYGARQTDHEWLLILNDDCYLKPGCVETMLREAKADTGILTPLIRFPSGRIYVSTKVRERGARGWSHPDYQKFDNSFPQVMETENACGCCMLIRRKAFYDAGCFDEDFLFYAEDDDLSLRVRRAGWRILFVPQATAVHEEGQTTQLFRDRQAIMNRSNALLAAKWKDYFDWNSDRVPIGNFDYTKA